jgi:hypothetical protein
MVIGLIFIVILKKRCARTQTLHQNDIPVTALPNGECQPSDRPPAVIPMTTMKRVLSTRQIWPRGSSGICAYVTQSELEDTAYMEPQCHSWHRRLSNGEVILPDYLEPRRLLNKYEYITQPSQYAQPSTSHDAHSRRLSNPYMDMGGELQVQQCNCGENCGLCQIQKRLKRQKVLISGAENLFANVNTSLCLRSQNIYPNFPLPREIAERIVPEHIYTEIEEIHKEQPNKDKGKGKGQGKHSKGKGQM